MEEAVSLLKDLLAIKSVNGIDNEGDAALFLCRYFTAAGIPARVQEMDDKHSNVIALLEGDDTETITVWNGHLDTVPYGSMKEWITNPAVPAEEDGYLYGRGSSDMKSGLGAMVYALCAYRKSGKKPKHTIRFLGTCDEENGGLGALAIIEEGLMDHCQEILIGEPTDCRLGVAQKGCLWLELTVRGKTSHGAYPEEGCNAVDFCFEIANRLKQLVQSYHHPILNKATAQITQISGGVAPNMTPDVCTILMDIRLVPGLDKEQVLKEAEKIADHYRKQCSPNLETEFSVKNDRRAIEISSDHPMTCHLADCVRRSGHEVIYTGINYFTDASILVKHAPDTAVLLFGPGEPGMAHKPNERVELKKYMQAIQVLTDMIL